MWLREAGSPRKLRLTRPEQGLVQHVVRGELFDLSGHDVAHDERRSAMLTRPGRVSVLPAWDRSRTIRAAVIRDILRGRLARDPDPQGLRLKGAWIVGQVDLDNLTTNVDVWLFDCVLSAGLTAWNAQLPSLGLEGCWVDGEVNLAGAQLGMLACGAATMRNTAGPALYANGIRIEHGLVLTAGFDAEGAGNAGAVHLGGARVGGWVNCSRARIRNSTGPALAAAQLHAGALRLDNGFDAAGAGDDVVLDLARASIGTLVFDPARLDHATDPQARLRVDGLTYIGLPEGLNAQQWLRLLRTATPAYAAQPYQQLAATHRAAGHDSEVRTILIAQRRDQIHRKALTRRTERAWVRLTGLTLGYGYQPWRALLALLVIVATATILATTLGAHGGLAHSPTTTVPAAPCSVIERLGVGLDYALPLIKPASRACEITNTATGQILTGTSWLLQLLAWAFATLFIAGFTSAVRKT